MKWKILLLAFLLIAAATTVNLFAAPIYSCVSTLATYDSSRLVLDGDGNSTSTGGGDPVPGGGIPR